MKKLAEMHSVEGLRESIYRKYPLMRKYDQNYREDLAVKLAKKAQDPELWIYLLLGSASWHRPVADLSNSRTLNDAIFCIMGVGSTYYDDIYDLCQTNEDVRRAVFKSYYSVRGYAFWLIFTKRVDPNSRDYADTVSMFTKLGWGNSVFLDYLGKEYDKNDPCAKQFAERVLVKTRPDVLLDILRSKWYSLSDGVKELLWEKSLRTKNVESVANFAKANTYLIHTQRDFRERFCAMACNAFKLKKKPTITYDETGALWGASLDTVLVNDSNDRLATMAFELVAANRGNVDQNGDQPYTAARIITPEIDKKLYDQLVGCALYNPEIACHLVKTGMVEKGDPRIRQAFDFRVKNNIPMQMTVEAARDCVDSGMIAPDQKELYKGAISGIFEKQYMASYGKSRNERMTFVLDVRSEDEKQQARKRWQM